MRPSLRPSGGRPGGVPDAGELAWRQKLFVANILFMRISLLAGAAAGCAAVLFLQPLAVGAVADPSPTRRTSAGDGSVTALPLGHTEHGFTPRATKPFSLVGVSWDDPRGSLDGGSVRVRTRSIATGTWGEWRHLDVDGEDAPDERDGRDGARGASAPLWTGPSDGVAIEVTPVRADCPPGCGPSWSTPVTVPPPHPPSRAPFRPTRHPAGGPTTRHLGRASSPGRAGAPTSRCATRASSTPGRSGRSSCTTPPPPPTTRAATRRR